MKGILFKPEMIKATVEGRKTQTRRIINPQPENCEDTIGKNYYAGHPELDDYVFCDSDGDVIDMKCPQPRYQVGDIVYIKESGAWDEEHKHNIVFYKANTPDIKTAKWQSPLFMPEWAARYFIKIVGVRPERLHDITDSDAIAEGITVIGRPELNELSRGKFIHAYKRLWDSINKKAEWSSNPWVWRYEFELVKRP